MTNAQSFPLCRLPSVACSCVLKQFGLREKYIMTTLSKRARRAMRVAILKESYLFSFEVNYHCGNIEMRKGGSLAEEYWFELKVYSTGDAAAPEDAYVLWTDDMKTTLAEQLESIHDVFKCSEIWLKFFGNPNVPEITQHLVPIIRKLKLNLLDVAIEANEPNDEFFDYVMETFRDVSTLSNRVDTSPEYELRMTEPFSFRRCSFCAPSQFTMEHLTTLFMNCKSIEVGSFQHAMTPASLNMFLKKWIENSELEYVELDFHQPEQLPLVQILDGIPNTPVDEAYVENRLQEFPDGEAVMIRQNSGVEAVFCVYLHAAFALTTHFADPQSDLWSDDDEEEEEENDEEEEEIANDEVDDEEPSNLFFVFRDKLFEFSLFDISLWTLNMIISPRSSLASLAQPIKQPPSKRAPQIPKRNC